MNGASTEFLYQDGVIVEDIDSATQALKMEYGYEPDGGLFAVRTPTWAAFVISDPRTGTTRRVIRLPGRHLVKAYGQGFWGDFGAGFSNTMQDTGTIIRQRFAGHEYDQETGLYYMGARYYDPKLGRFLSEDPAGLGGGLNLYSYASNDPINLTDLDGTDPDQCPKNDEGMHVCKLDPINDPAYNDPSRYDFLYQAYQDCMRYKEVANPDGCGDADRYDVSNDPPPPVPLKSSGPSCIGLVAAAVAQITLDATGVNELKAAGGLALAGLKDLVHGLGSWLVAETPRGALTLASAGVKVTARAELRTMGTTTIAIGAQQIARSSINSLEVSTQLQQAQDEDEEPTWLTVAGNLPILGSGVAAYRATRCLVGN